MLFAYLLKEAARHAATQHRIEQGKGVALDYVSAYMWYKSASDGGERLAKIELQALSKIMTEEQIKHAVAAAEKLPLSRSPIQEGITSETIGSPFIQKR